ncbi:MAG: tryptophan--tRNA ligase [Bacilli bacterium]|nr:tryptophan--tRNA ligase [Bacilli bacterium]
MANIALTGDRPTGRLHIGHYAGSLKERVAIQNSGAVDELFIMIADTQALTDNAGNPQKVRDNIIEVILDYISAGIDLDKTTIFIQSEVRALPEITTYYMNLVTLPRLLRNPTVKAEIAYRGFDSDTKGVPVGFANYPISQAADITAFNANRIPVGDDQLPMIEQTREIVRAFNNQYNTDCLVMPDAVLPKNNVCKRLPGIDGSLKMSKSLGNAIYLADTSEEVKKKIFSMYTDPNHIRVEDPGKVEGNVVFTYLDAFSTDEHFKRFYPEFNNLDELKKAYEHGGIGDMKIKTFLYNVMEDILTPIRERRKEYEKKIELIFDYIKKGNEKANKVADETLGKIRKAMGIDYFTDDTFVKEQIEKYN